MLSDLIAGFESANKGIKVEEQGIDFSSYDTMLKTKLAGGDAPDLIMGRPKMYIDLIRAGHIEPLTDEEFITGSWLSASDPGHFPPFHPEQYVR